MYIGFTSAIKSKEHSNDVIKKSKNEKSFYVIDTDQVDIHFALMVNPGMKFKKDDKSEQYLKTENVADKMIYFSAWFRAELAIVYVHLIIKSLFVLPIILIILLMEVSYSFYANNIDDDSLITK